MASELICFSFTLCLCFLPVLCTSDQCVPLKDGPFKPCTISGYNHTFPIPQDLSSRSRVRLKKSIDYITGYVKNCSVASIGETMACSYLAPYCKNGNAILPCRRVCSEFLKRCAGTFPPFITDMLISICSVLPNRTFNKGNCYEPPDFVNYHNASSKGPLERKCEKIIFPFCENMGYPLTTIQRKRQLDLYNIMYKKNYTIGDKDIDKPAAGSRIQFMKDKMANYSSCALNLQKLFCADVIPPCFAGEGLAYYTVCKNVCLSIATQCPEVFLDNFGYFLYCERMAEGNINDQSGFCRHTSWPPPMKWLDVFKEGPTSPTKEKGGIGGVVIAVIVLVPLIIVAVVIALIWWLKIRRLTSKGYARQEDDKADLVT